MVVAMNLLTPSNLQYCLGISISSRLLVILLQLASNFILDDHNADAYRNKYHQSFTNYNQTLDLLPNAYRYLFKCIEGLTKWDSQYFLEISKDGYVSEQHLAFLPFFPMVISFSRHVIFGHARLSFEHFLPFYSIASTADSSRTSVIDLQTYIQSALIGVAVNNFILMPIACIFLFALTKLVKRNDEHYARSVAWWFCYNPASIFFSSCYSESLFASLTFIAMFIIEFRSQKFLSKYPNDNNKQERSGFVPLHHLNRLIYIILPALIPLALSSATRSNGLVNVGFIIFHFLIKYATLLKAEKKLWPLLAYISLILEIIQDVLVLVMSSVLAASGYISFQIYSFIRFCTQNNARSKGSFQTKPLWCNNLLPHPYGQVQAKYWNVGMFRYYELKQLPNFLLAAPVTFIVLVGSLGWAKERRRATKPLKSLVAFYVQAISLTLLCSVSINIQVITRLLLSSCPAIYWICADMAQVSRIRSKILMTYFLLYFIVGTVLHSNFYPWT